MPAEQFHNQAAVLIAIADLGGGQDAVLLTKRARHLSIHGGEVALPGGKWEPSDADLRATALRESEEEVGLDATRISDVQQLAVARTRQGLQVTPFVGRLNSHADLWPNPDELDALFWVPLHFFLGDPRSQTDIFQLRGRQYWSPVYLWAEYRIWGFTSRVLVDYLNLVHGARIQRAHAAPEVRYGAAGRVD